jgi:hypothetical protein
MSISQLMACVGVVALVLAAEPPMFRFAAKVMRSRRMTGIASAKRDP